MHACIIIGRAWSCTVHRQFCGVLLPPTIIIGYRPCHTTQRRGPPLCSVSGSGNSSLSRNIVDTHTTHDGRDGVDILSDLLTWPNSTGLTFHKFCLVPRGSSWSSPFLEIKIIPRIQWTKQKGKEFEPPIRMKSQQETPSVFFQTWTQTKQSLGLSRENARFCTKHKKPGYTFGLIWCPLNDGNGQGPQKIEYTHTRKLFLGGVAVYQ